MSGLLALDLGNARLVASPQNRLAKELGLGNTLGTDRGGNLAAASVFCATVCLRVLFMCFSSVIS